MIPVPGEAPPVDPSSVRKILIRSTNWLGDVIMQIPLIRKTAEVFPEADIDVMARPAYQPLISQLNCVNRVFGPAKLGGIRDTVDNFKYGRELRQSRYDLAIIVPRSFRSAFSVTLAGIPCRIGYKGKTGRSFLLTHRLPNPRDYYEDHRVHYYLRLLSFWEDTLEFHPPSLAVSSQMRERAKEILDEAFKEDVGNLGPIVALNPGGAYGTAKRWLPEKFAELAQDLSRKGRARTIFLGSPAEVSLGDQVAGTAGPGAVNLAGKTSLTELASVLTFCKLLITNDTGTMHLADAVGTPVVAIFGPTDPAGLSPYSGRCSIIREPVDCSPCYLRHCPIDHRCMTRISVERVFDACHKWF